MAKPDRKGRNLGRFVALPHYITGSDAWRSLSGNAMKVYVALSRFNNGDNNGQLFMSIEKGVEETSLARNTVAKALRDLQEHGLIAPVVKGHFKVKGGPATTWRLTHLPCPRTQPRAATNDFRDWKGNKSRAQILNGTVSVSGPGAKTFPSAVSKPAITLVETPHVSVRRSLPENDTQLVCHGEGGHLAVSRREKQIGLEDEIGTRLPELPDQVRANAIAYLKSSPVGAQSRLAEAAKIPGGTLSKFLSGRGLAERHLEALRQELGRRVPHAA